MQTKQKKNRVKRVYCISVIGMHVFQSNSKKMSWVKKVTDVERKFKCPI